MDAHRDVGEEERLQVDSDLGFEEEKGMDMDPN